MFQVMAEMCNECLFSPNRIVSSARMKQLLMECKHDDSFFICHKSTIKNNGNVCCRGFYDLDPCAANIMRIAARLGLVEFVDV